MFQDDYILRMIEQMGDILRKVLSLEKEQKFKEGHEEINKAMRKLGISRLLARTMPANELIRLVRRPGEPNTDRCILLSRLIGADAHVYEAEGERGTAHSLYTTSLEILYETAQDEDGEKLENINKDIDAIKYHIGENIKSDNSNLDL